MKRFKVAAGNIVHIQGIPFRLSEDTILEGHSGNIALVADEESLPHARLNFNPSIFHKIRCWWHSW